MRAGYCLNLLNGYESKKKNSRIKRWQYSAGEKNKYARAISYGGRMSNEQTFKIALSREALKYYTKVSVNTAAKLDKCFASLESDPVKGPNIKPFKGMSDKYRYRVGNLRIIYELDIPGKIVYILAILPRGQSYKHTN